MTWFDAFKIMACMVGILAVMVACAIVAYRLGRRRDRAYLCLFLCGFGALVACCGIRFAVGQLDRCMYVLTDGQWPVDGSNGGFSEE